MCLTIATLVGSRRTEKRGAHRHLAANMVAEPWRDGEGGGDAEDADGEFGDGEEDRTQNRMVDVPMPSSAVQTVEMTVAVPKPTRK